HSFASRPTPTTDFSTLSLHDALPIYAVRLKGDLRCARRGDGHGAAAPLDGERVRRVEPRHDLINDALAVIVRHATRGLFGGVTRSEEHTSELQSLAYLVCRLLLEKKK